MTVGVNITQSLYELINSRYTNEVSDSIQRLSTGLRINNASDDIGGLISSNSLKNVSSGLTQGIENGNNGLALVQVSNKALGSQLSILNTIKEKLDISKLQSTDDASKDAIRVDIIDLITQLDDIAADANYNDIYTLQKASADSDFSLATTITLESGSVTTESIRSNSDGLSLDTLKNLAASGLTQDVSVEQLDIVTAAITTIEGYEDDFDRSKTEFEIAINNLIGIEKTTSASKDEILNTNEADENAILDKYKLLEKQSEFAIVQANITQAIVLKLLATPVVTPEYNTENKNIPDYSDKSETDYTNNTNNTSYADNSSTNTSYSPNNYLSGSYDAPKSSSSSASTNTSE